MKNVYGYIRVSTVKQGTGVSLQEQKEAIIRYAEKHNLNIIEWFEEQETAAKQGRPLFNKMMKLVKSGKATGVIIHKIDRSARNLKDWASLGDLIDQGYEIHFAHESLDMKGRGGRLAADIQAVIASDYIRNLREEAMKGLYGRLKQGLYPWGAPIGYLNQGGGKVKIIDPINGPLVKKAFELYSQEKYSLDELAEKMYKLGLRNTKGGRVLKPALSEMLNNPFYVGIIKVKDKSFQGKHEVLISTCLYQQVQNVLKGKTNSKIVKHEFLFRRLIKCFNCKYSLVGERQKGIVYYRCHTKSCPTTAVREELIEKNILNQIEEVRLHQIENDVLSELLNESQVNWSGTQKGLEESLRLQKNKLQYKQERLTDAYLDGVMNKEEYELKKEQILIETQSVNSRILNLDNRKDILFRKAKHFLELVKNLKNVYLNGIVEEKRRMLKILTSNFYLHEKKLMFTMNSPFQDIANHYDFLRCGHSRNTLRNCTVENDKLETTTVIPVDNEELRARMKELLDIIMGFFEHQVENDQDNEEELLFDEMFNTSTKHPL